MKMEKNLDKLNECTTICVGGFQTGMVEIIKVNEKSVDLIVKLEKYGYNKGYAVTLPKFLLKIEVIDLSKFDGQKIYFLHVNYNSQTSKYFTDYQKKVVGIMGF